MGASRLGAARKNRWLVSARAPCLRLWSFPNGIERRMGIVTHGLRLLLVEDDVDSGDAMSTLLRHEGVHVDRAATGEDAIARYALEPHHRFDLILLDLMLPDMDGATLIHRLASIAPLPPVVIHTAASESKARDAGAAVGAAAILRKPTDWGKMREILERFRVVGTGTADGVAFRAGEAPRSRPVSPG